MVQVSVESMMTGNSPQHEISYFHVSYLSYLSYLRTATKQQLKKERNVNCKGANRLLISHADSRLSSDSQITCDFNEPMTALKSNENSDKLA